MKFDVDVDAVQKMNPTNFDHAITFQILLAFTELVLSQLLNSLP